MEITKIMSVLDWLSIIWYFGLWIGYHYFALYRARYKPSLLGVINHYRLEWMKQVPYRENRVVDGMITNTLASSPTFFASTTTLVIGALFAALSSFDQSMQTLGEILLTKKIEPRWLEGLIILLIVVFTYAFFRFTWALRQFNFVAILIGSAPSALPSKTQDLEDQVQLNQKQQDFVERSSKLVSLAGETFNDGLRAYYFGFAATSWLLGAWAFMLSTALVVILLYRREFQSQALSVIDKKFHPY